MAIKILGNYTREQFIQSHKRLYRFMPVNEFFKMLHTGKYIFRNPSAWNDPFEKYFLDREYRIKNTNYHLSIKNNLFASCFSKTSNSEAYWNVYTPNSDGVRIEFSTEIFLDNFLSRIVNADVYMGSIKYYSTNEFHKTDIDIKRLSSSITNNNDHEVQAELMFRKRKAFLYEDEVRIMILPHKAKKSNGSEITIPINLSAMIKSVYFDPRFGLDHFNYLKKSLLNNYGIRISKAELYKEIKGKPMDLIYKK
jgi:hypothetical protein